MYSMIRCIEVPTPEVLYLTLLGFFCDIGNHFVVVLPGVIRPVEDTELEHGVLGEVSKILQWVIGNGPQMRACAST